MSIVFRTPTAQSSNTGTEPGGTVQGDVLIAIADGTSAPTLPTGWTSLGTASDPSTSRYYLVAAIIRGASAPSYQFANAIFVAVYCAEASSFTGSPLLANLAATFSMGSGTTQTNLTCPAITELTGNDGVIAWARSSVSPATWSSPTGFTEGVSNSVGSNTLDGYGDVSATGTGPYTLGSTSTSGHVDSISIRVGNNASPAGGALPLLGVG